MEEEIEMKINDLSSSTGVAYSDMSKISTGHGQSS